MFMPSVCCHVVGVYYISQKPTQHKAKQFVSTYRLLSRIVEHCANVFCGMIAGAVDVPSGCF